MRLATATVCVLSFLLCAGQALAEPVPMACDKGFAKLGADIRAAGHGPTGPAAPNVERVDDPDNAAVYFLTRPGHPAYPGIIRQDLGLEADGINVHTEGCVYGDADAFRDWFETVRARVDEIRAQLEAHRPPPKPPHP